MVTRRTTKAAPTKRANSAPRGNAAPRKAAPAKKAAAPAKAERDVTQYADKPASDYHKAFARWIVQEVGYDPDSATSKKAAFLAGVSIATAARPAFMDSEFLEEWRESTGTAKRGPKPKDEEPTRRRSRQTVSDDEFEEEADEDDEEFEDDESDDSDEEFEDEDDSEEFEDDEEFEDEEEEPEPPRKRTTKRAPAKATKAAPAKRTRGKAADDEFLF